MLFGCLAVLFLFLVHITVWFYFGSNCSRSSKLFLGSIEYFVLVVLFLILFESY